MPCRCRKGKGLRVTNVTTTTTTVAVTVDGGVKFSMTAGGQVRTFGTRLEAEAAAVRSGGGVVRPIK